MMAFNGYLGREVIRDLNETCLQMALIVSSCRSNRDYTFGKNILFGANCLFHLKN
jgi:hypothetical protein